MTGYNFPQQNSGDVINILLSCVNVELSLNARRKLIRCNHIRPSFCRESTKLTASDNASPTFIHATCPRHQ